MHIKLVMTITISCTACHDTPEVAGLLTEQGTMIRKIEMSQPKTTPPKLKLDRFACLIKTRRHHCKNGVDVEPHVLTFVTRVGASAGASGRAA